MIVFFSCNREESCNLEYKTNTEYISFEQEFSEIRRQHSELFSTFQNQHYKTRATESSENSNDDNIERFRGLANEVDSQLVDFYRRNEIFLRRFSPNISMSQDDFELMLFDNDILLECIRTNFSPELYDIVESYLIYSTKPSTIEISNLNPLEEVIAYNMEVLFDLSTTLDGFMSDYQIVSDNLRYRRALKYCKEDLEMELNLCWEQACHNLGGSIILAIIFTPETLGSSLGVASGGVIINYFDCRTHANNKYNTCIDRAKEEYGQH